MRYAVFLLLITTATFAGDERVRMPSEAPQAPSASQRLTADQLYVVHSDDPCLVLHSPKGYLKLTVEQGPIRLRGRFVDGVGVETRVIASKHVYIIEAAMTGRCELLVIPTGTVDEASVKRRTLDVEAGEGPRPPPPTPTPVSSFRVIIVYEASATYPATTVSTLYGKEVEAYLDARCTKDGTVRGWVRHDKDDVVITDVTTMNALWAAVKPKVTAVPCVAIEVNGKVTIEPLPTTPAAMVTLLKKYSGDS